MSELKYKIGDKVRIKSLDWYNENKDKNGNIVFSSKVPHFALCVNVRTVFTKDMVKYCGKVVTIENVWTANYSIVEGTHRDYFTDEMIEGLVEEIKPKFKVGDSVEVLKTGNTYTISQVKFNGKEFVYTFSTTDNSACWFSEEELKPIHFIDIAIKPHNVRGDEIIKMLEELGGTNAFSFDGSDHNCVNPFAYYIDNDDKQIYGGGIEFLRKNGYKIHALEELKKKEYPKTFEECVHVLEGENRMSLEQMNTFRKLIDARNAYWKIYGEENGLGKPWEPDYTKERYIIYKWVDEIFKGYKAGGFGERFILEFPTEEMRDAFYENFKSEIESCKEFL